MANCQFLLNDGASLIVLNDGTACYLAMNDDSCVAADLQGATTGSSFSAGRMIKGKWVPVKNDGSKGQFTRKRYDQINAEAKAEYDAKVAAEEEKRRLAAEAKEERIAKYKADRAARIQAIKDKR